MSAMAEGATQNPEHPESTMQPVTLEDEKSLVGSLLAQRQEFLALTENRDTPLYVFAPDVVEDRYFRFKRAFEAYLDDFRVFYACKSNNHPLMAAKLTELGAGLDVSSGVELEAGLAAGSRNMVFSGPGKTRAELELAVANRDKVMVHLDSFGELERLDQAVRRLGGPVKAGVRISAQSGGSWRKFGIPLSSLERFWSLARQKEMVHLCGLQFHTSWNMGPEAQVDFIRELGNYLLTQGQKFFQELEFIDIGGGFWPERGEWLPPEALSRPRVQPAPLCNPAKPIEFFAREIAGALERHIFPLTPCGILAEPGRWLADGAMHLLVRVIDKKAADLVITDGGIHLFGWEKFESEYIPVINLSRPSFEKRACLVCGSLCTPRDFWGWNYFGQSIEEGDVLLIPDQGAYTYSLRQNFIKPLAQTAVLAEEFMAELLPGQRGGQTGVLRGLTTI